MVSNYRLYREKHAIFSTPQAITKEKAFNSLNPLKLILLQMSLTTQAEIPIV
ncbi:hypothetical protein HMPREF1408_01267, partial [Helicobacter pylori GAM245Ai]